MLDPRIALATTVPDIGKTFSNILTNVGRLDTIRENRELAPFRKQALLDAQEQGGLNRELTQTQIDNNLVSNMSNREKQWASSIYQGAMGVKPFLDNQDGAGALNYLQQRYAQLKQQGMNTQHTEQAIQQLQSDPRGFINSVDAAIQSFQALQQGQTARQREFENNIKYLTPEQQQIAREVEAGVTARAGSSAQERILTNPDLASADIEHESNLSEAKEGGKLTKQLKFKPLIQKAVKIAEADATAQGETLTSYKRAKAALPGLKDSIEQLRSLAPIATSTWGGRVFDAAVKETGFGATKGSTARAKFIAIIDNQVLPLLKETFGAAFTVQEGESLKATMGDPNASEDEKMAQLDAFIAQKMRTLEGQERELQDTSTPSQVIQFDAQGNMIQ